MGDFYHLYVVLCHCPAWPAGLAITLEVTKLRCVNNCLAQDDQESYNTRRSRVNNFFLHIFEDFLHRGSTWTTAQDLQQKNLFIKKESFWMSSNIIFFYSPLQMKRTYILFEGNGHVGLARGICPTQVLSKMTTLTPKKKLQDSKILWWEQNKKKLFIFNCFPFNTLCFENTSTHFTSHCLKCLFHIANHIEYVWLV